MQHMPTEFSALATTCLQELMDRHGVPKHKQAGIVTKVLELSRSHGNRKLHGIFPMTFDEVGRIAEHFGETLVQALEPSLAHGMERAVMMVGELEMPCEVMLGEVLRPPFEGEKIVAVGVPGSFLVVPAAALTLSARRVTRLLMRFGEQGPTRTG
jgi:hypothetical protein